MSLYSITTEYRSLINAIAEGEIPEEAIADTLEAVEGEWDARAEAVISAIKNIKAEAAGIEAEISALEERKKRKKRTVEKLSEYLSLSMQGIGRSTYESSKHSVSFKKSTAIRITDEAEFIAYALREHPEAVRKKESIEPDKAAIKELLKTVNLPHVAVEVKQNIQIK